MTVLALAITACGSQALSGGETTHRLSNGDYGAAMQHAERFSEPGGAVFAPLHTSEQLRDEPPSGRDLGMTAAEAAELLKRR